VSIQRYATEQYSYVFPCEDGEYVAYEDHAELMADLQRRLDETEMALADAEAEAAAIDARLAQAEKDIAALDRALNVDTYPGT